jgi:hypothetical protein
VEKEKECKRRIFDSDEDSLASEQALTGKKKERGREETKERQTL